MPPPVSHGRNDTAGLPMTTANGNVRHARIVQSTIQVGICALAFWPWLCEVAPVGRTV